MSHGIQTLKMILAAAGITVDQVNFDSDARAIVCIYSRAGQAQTKIIPFSEIEDLFTDAPARPPGAAPVDKRGGEASPAPP